MAKIPSMGVTGWLSDVASRADYVISTFILAQTSMSVLHRNQNTSFPYLLKEYANQMLSLQTKLQDELNTKLQAVFGQSANAYVEIKAEDATLPDQFSISFTGIVYENNKEYTVGKLAQYQNSRVVAIANINNG